jgi:hypothetical protein
MASPAPKPPAGTPNDEALDILRRLEPTLARVATKDDVAKVDDRLRKLEADVAEIKGRLSELSARVPSIWTIAAMIVSLFGAAFVLIRFASGH